MGLQFDRELKNNPELNEAFSKCGKSHAEKAAFRLKWGKTCYETLVKKKTYTESFCQVDTNLGQYMPLSVIVQKEGGDADAQAAAVRYAAKCLAMGGPWTSHNDMTERLEYLYMVRTSRTELMQCWSLYEEQATTPARMGGAANSTVDGNANKGDGNTSTDTSTNKSNQGKSQQGKGDKDKESKSKTTTSTFTRTLSVANKVKALHASVLASATALHESIETTPEWAWARPAVQLAAKISELKSGLKPFDKEFLIKDIKDMKAEYTPELLCTELVNFAKVEQLVRPVEVELKRLAAMQAASRRF